jgi:hypothetical protein
MLRFHDSFVMMLCGRGTGKSCTAALRAFLHADTLPDQTVLLIAPAQRTAFELMRWIKHIFNVLSVKSGVIRETQTEIHFNNGSRVIVIPGATDETIRGYRADLIIADEGSRLSDEVFAALIPMLKKNGIFITASTPYGRRGWFWESWSQGHGKQIIVRSTELPRMAAIVERDRKILTDAQFRQEHLVTFLGSGSQYFSIESVDRAFVTNVLASKLSCLHAVR